MNEQNRRKHPRVNYPCQLTMWVTQGLYDTVLAQMTDIGLGGLCARFNEEIALGIKLDIQIEFTDMKPFTCKGFVVRCQKISEHDYNVGIQFESLNELQHGFLSGIISKLIIPESKGK